MTKQYYQFNAEHISRPTAVKLVRELEDKGIEVEYASNSYIFENELIMVVQCDEVEANMVKNYVWGKNNGACCDMQIITANELDALL